MSLAISTSASSPVSTTSTSPAPPATPLTPSTTASVAFNLQGDFNFDALRLPSQDNSATQGTNPAAGAANQGNAGPVRRKPSRRANTAERRATHNAVERQRRETLNGRFLDLAALLPNLASVRRPSKSAIVNSSIAVIHAQRRARCIAARELRLLKLEADALRAEVNEWRERSGMARADEPLRSREFEELVSGGLEEAEEGLIEEERRALEIVKEGLRLDAGNLGADALSGPFAFNMSNSNMMFGLAEDDEEDSSDSHSAHIRPGSQGSVGSVPSIPMTIPVPRPTAQVNTPTSAGPMIFDPTAALLQSHPTHNAGINAFGPFDGSFDVNAHPAAQQFSFPGQLERQSQEKLAAWNAQNFILAAAQQHQQQFAQQNNSFYSDDGSVSSSVGSAHGADVHQMQQNALRSRSSSTIPGLASSPVRGTMTPPSSAPATATTYAEASGDVFNAAYGYGANGWKNHGKELMVGGGNGFGATMGLFM